MVNKDVKKGNVIKKGDLIYLRPNVKNGFQPYELSKKFRKKIKSKINIKSQAILKKDLK